MDFQGEYFTAQLLPNLNQRIQCKAVQSKCATFKRSRKLHVFLCRHTRVRLIVPTEPIHAIFPSVALIAFAIVGRGDHRPEGWHVSIGRQDGLDSLSFAAWINSTRKPHWSSNSQRPSSAQIFELLLPSDTSRPKSHPLCLQI
jgi:hypothetical protein